MTSARRLLDADLNGITIDQTVSNLGTCNTGLPEFRAIEWRGALADQARVWLRDCSGAKNAGQFASCVNKVTTAASRSGLITSAQKEAIAACTGQAFGTQ